MLGKLPDLTGQALADQVKTDFGVTITKATTANLRSVVKRGDKPAGKKRAPKPKGTSSHGRQSTVGNGIVSVDDLGSLADFVRGFGGLGRLKDGIAVLEKISAEL